MNDPFQLVTNCNFKGKDYLVQMCVIHSKKLELTITDKIMAEDWQCEYDASYIEALTHKTGNFKQFNVFVMMLKSGLLKTSDCISLDLLTLEDLEQLRCKKIVSSQHSSRTCQTLHLNRRYLILTYSVEFDRIHYPLPLDYCGPPDPTVLQNNIRRLEGEIERLKQKNSFQTKSDIDVKKLKEKIHNLLEENKHLTNEIHRLNKIISKRIKPMRDNQVLLNSLKNLEEQVLYEKCHNRQFIFKLKAENQQLKQQVEEFKKKEISQYSKQEDAPRYNRPRSSKKFSRNSVTPDISLERKKNLSGNHVDSQFSCPNWNNPNNDLKIIRKTPNRYLSSSSSESERKIPHIARSREKKPPARQIFSKTGRRSSKEKSSEDSKRNPLSHRSKFSAVSCEGKPGGSVIHSAKSRSRETSLSSRASSKRSKVSRPSNRGSGDCGGVKKLFPNDHPNDREDIKFTMSDLEARIHSLQRLLSEGLHF